MTEEAKSEDFQQYYLAPETEEAVIGALLVNPEILPAVRAQLSPFHFRCGVGQPGGSHEEIYQAILDLAEVHGSFNNPMVRERLKMIRVIPQEDEQRLKLRMIDMMERGGALYGVEQLNIACSHLEDFYVRREGLGILGGVKEDLRVAKSASELVNGVMTKLNDLVGRTRNKVKSFADSLSDFTNHLSDDTLVQFLPTGFSQIDDIIDGFAPGDLIIVGARPSMGKTMFATNLAVQMAHALREKGDQSPVCFFSLEMSKEEILLKMLSRNSQVPAKVIKNKKLTTEEWTKYYEAAVDLESYPLELFDTQDNILTVPEVEGKIRRLMAQGKKPAAIIVDYLTRMNGTTAKGDKMREAEEITRGFQNLARQLGIPVILLSQLSRKLEERQDKRPILSDLRESGAIEQDADMCLFLYRDRYYNQQTPDGDVVEVLVRKNRKGEIGIAVLDYMPVTQTFFDSLKKYFDLSFYQRAPQGEQATGSRYGKRKKSVGGPPLEVLP